MPDVEGLNAEVGELKTEVGRGLSPLAPLLTLTTASML